MLVFSFCCWLLYIGACCELLFHNVAAAAVINVAAAAVNEVVGCCRWCCWSWLSKSQLVLVEVLCLVGRSAYEAEELGTFAIGRPWHTYLMSLPSLVTALQSDGFDKF